MNSHPYNQYQQGENPHTYNSNQHCVLHYGVGDQKLVDNRPNFPQVGPYSPPLLHQLPPPPPEQPPTPYEQPPPPHQQPPHHGYVLPPHRPPHQSHAPPPYSYAPSASIMQQAQQRKQQKKQKKKQGHTNDLLLKHDENKNTNQSTRLPLREPSRLNPIPLEDHKGRTYEKHVLNMIGTHTDNNNNNNNNKMDAIMIDKSYEEKTDIKNKKFALIIAITYERNSKMHTLHGCFADAIFTYNKLTEMGFLHENITVLTDSKKLIMNKSRYFPSSVVHEPTSGNIKYHYSKLVSNKEDGDILFFTYSGHGIQTSEYAKYGCEKDEDDRMDENLVGCNYLVDPPDQRAEYESGCQGLIIDDFLHSEVQFIPKGVTLICIVDCCNSGTSMDLPVSYLLESDLQTKGHIITKINQCKYNFNKCSDYGDVLLIASCEDGATIDDINYKGERGGPLISAFFDTAEAYYRSNTPITYKQVYEEIIYKFRASKNQNLKRLIPQLSSLKQMNIAQEIIPLRKW